MKESGASSKEELKILDDEEESEKEDILSDDMISEFLNEEIGPLADELPFPEQQERSETDNRHRKTVF